MKLFYTLILCYCLMLLGCQPTTPSKTLTIFAATSLTDVVQTFIGAYKEENPDVTIYLNLAGSSILARQIEQGASADLFFSADTTWTTYLQQKGFLEQVIFPISNKLVITTANTSLSFNTLNDITKVTSIALADPTHVPAGKYAKAALSCNGLWESVKDNIKPTLDVRASLQLVKEGLTEIGIVYASDIHLVANLHTLYTWNDTCQPKILYGFAQISETKQAPLAQNFLAFITHRNQVQQWGKFGFIPVFEL